MLYDLVICGGGASGLVAAITAAETGDKVLILEAGERIGKKISASGNGRCNLMNTNDPVYYGDTDFASSVLSEIGVRQQTDFWLEHGLAVCEDGSGRVYPASDLSSSVLDVIRMHLKKNGIDVCFHERAVHIAGDKQDGFTVNCASGHQWNAKRVIVACGGKAQPKLGGSEDGYSLLSALGHRIVECRPALTQLVTDSRSISGLKGIRQNRVQVSLKRKGALLHQEMGEILFTEYGVSGICVMQCARFASKGDQLCVAFAPSLGFADSDECENALRTRRTLFADGKPAELLNGWLNPKLGYAVCKKAGVDVTKESISILTDSELHLIAETLWEYPLTVEGTQGFETAQVTAGGLDCSGFDRHTMESKLVPGVYCTGETLNVDGDCGGFNLMFAFATGILAGRNGR